MQCPSCGAENPPGFTFCGHCGSPFTHVCPRCGFDNPAGVFACHRCGSDLLSRRTPSARTALEGERRFAVILFADIAGFTRLSEGLDPEEATWLVNRCLDEMTIAVVRYGGQVDKYIGDGLMGVFGAPVSHEDDPVRALRAALAMREQISSLRFSPQVPPLALHIGAACGSVVAAEMGSQRRKEYTVIGTAVNLAAHLEDASAPGQILISQDLHRLSEHAFEFQPMLLSDVRGLEGTVQAFELLGEQEGTVTPRGAASLRSPLVGRDAERATLERCLGKLCAGHGQIVSVIGEAGIGKSRLVDEVRQRAGSLEMEVTWLVGQAPSHGESVSYVPFRNIVRAAIGARPRMDKAKVRARLRGELVSLFADRWSEAYPYLARLLVLDLDKSSAELLQHLDGESLKWQISRAVCDFIARLCAGRPVVLVLEDLHWADPVSLELLEQVIALTAEARLMVVAISRLKPEWAYLHIREVVKKGYEHIYTDLRLRPLSETAADELVHNLLGRQEVPANVRELLLFRGGGNPLFIEELLSSMVDRDLLVQQNGKWKLTCSEEEVSIPETIQGIIQARVDRLDDEAKRVLQVAACIGQRFPYELLATAASVVGVLKDRLDQYLGTLEDAALIQREDEWLEREYAFKHVLIRDTVHNGLLKDTRSQFHIAVAQWYEQNTLEGPGPPYALLAYHYEQTDNHEKQRLYFSKAGHQAAQNHALHEACTFTAKALTLTTSPIQRFELLLARERVCDLMGDRVQQRADLEELLRLADQEDDDGRRAMVHNRLATWYASQGNYPAAYSTAEKGLDAARRAGDTRMEARNLQVIASAAWRQGRFTAALGAGQAALGVSRAAGDPAGEATSLTTMGVVHRSRGELASARACYQKALDIRRAIGDRRGEAISLSQLGNALYDLGEYTGAFDHHQQALDLFRLIGDRRSQAWSLSGLGTIYLACGDYEAARDCHEQALAIRRAVSDRRGEAVSLGDLGNVLLATGDLEAAQACLEQAVVITRGIGARRDEVHNLTYLARALEKMGDLDKAHAAHQAALSRRRERRQRAASIENVAGLGRVALERDDLEAARAYAEEVLAYIREHGLVHIEPPFLVYHTCISILQACGEEDVARGVLEEAYKALMERAERIADAVLRRSFLELVPEHREIVAAWEEGGRKI